MQGLYGLEDVKVEGYKFSQKIIVIIYVIDSDNFDFNWKSSKVVLIF